MRECPTEDVEESAFSDWCDLQGLTHWHVPQETYTTSWKQKAHNKALGVRSGVSDHWVIIQNPYKETGKMLLAIEFKRKFGNTPTDEQIDFLHKLDEVDNVGAICCYGCDEAIKLVEELQVGKFDTADLCWNRMEKIRISRQNRRKSAKKPQNTEKSAKNELPY